MSSAIYALESFYTALKTAVEATWTKVVGEGDDAVVVTLVPVDWGQTRPMNVLNYGDVGRVVVVPGSEDGGMGEVGGPKLWPQPAKSLLCLNETFRVYVYGHDPTALQGPDYDRLEDHAGMRVLHEVLRQIWNVSHNVNVPVTSPVKIGSPRQLRPVGQRACGREYMISGIIEQPVLDMADTIAPFANVAPARSDITDSLGNVSETSHTEIPDET